METSLTSTYLPDLQDVISVSFVSGISLQGLRYDASVGLIASVHSKPHCWELDTHLDLWRGTKVSPAACSTQENEPSKAW